MSEMDSSAPASQQASLEMLTHAARVAQNLPEGRLDAADGRKIVVKRLETEDSPEVVVSWREHQPTFSSMAFYVLRTAEPSLNVSRFGLDEEKRYLEQDNFEGLMEYHESLFRDARALRQGSSEHDVDVLVSVMRSLGATAAYTFAESRP